MVWSLSSATALIRPRSSRTSHSPKRMPSGWTARAIPLRIRASLTAAVVAVGAVTIGDQPAEDGIAEQVADFLVAAAADMEDGGGAPPTASARARLATIVGVDDAGGPHLFEQILDDRFAGNPDLAQAAVEGAHRQRHAEPGHQGMRRRD